MIPLPQDDRELPTAEVSFDKDQVDCLLIVCNNQKMILTDQIKNFQRLKEDSMNYLMHNYEVSKEEAEDHLNQQHALNQSLLMTLPGVIKELLEMYPYLQEKTKESQIIIPKPTWKRRG